MKKRGYILLVIVSALLCSVESFAQTDWWKNNWTLQATLGAQNFFVNKSAPVTGGASGLYSIAVLNEYRSCSSLRFKMDGISLSSSRPIVAGKVIPYSYAFISGQIDWLFNIHAFTSQVDANYLPWEISPYIGLGINSTWAGKMRSVMGLNTGVVANAKLTDCIRLCAEVQLALLPDNFDRAISNRAYEPVLGFSVGVQYRFGKRKHTDSTAPEVMQQLVVPVQKIDTVYAAKNSSPIIIKDTIYVAHGDSMDIDKRGLGKIIFEEGNKRVRVSKNKIVIDAILQYLNEDPSNKILIRGYADPSEEIDDRQSVATLRALNVEMMFKSYDIDPLRMRWCIFDSAPYYNREKNCIVVLFKDNDKQPIIDSNNVNNNKK